MSDYSRKDYERVAALLGSELAPFRVSLERRAIERVVVRFADMFGEDNPRFDRDRFLRAIDAVAGKDAIGEVRP